MYDNIHISNIDCEVFKMRKCVEAVNYSALGMLKEFVPCKCHERPRTVCDYRVEVEIEKPIVNGMVSSPISLVNIQCNVCGKRNIIDTSKYVLMESFLEFLNDKEQ